jgi:hypothetical protein
MLGQTFGPYKTEELADRYANALRRAGLPE